MSYCKTPFFIWFTGRTGSTYLCDLLDSHPDIFCRKEQFCEFKIEDRTDLAPGIRTVESAGVNFGRQLVADAELVDDPSDAQTLEYLDRIFSRERGASGFKLKFPMQAAVYPEVVEKLMSIEQLKVIELIRENVLKQAISLENFRRILKLNNIASGNSLQPVELPPLQLDIEACIKHANYFSRIRDEFCEFSRRFKNVLPVKYEELLSQNSATMKKILEFLGVDSDVELKTDFEKATPDKISSAVANYEELQDAVKGTLLAQYLD